MTKPRRGARSEPAAQVAGQASSHRVVADVALRGDEGMENRPTISHSATRSAAGVVRNCEESREQNSTDSCRGRRFVPSRCASATGRPASFHSRTRSSVPRAWRPKSSRGECSRCASWRTERSPGPAVSNCAPTPCAHASPLCVSVRAAREIPPASDQRHCGLDRFGVG